MKAKSIIGTLVVVGVIVVGGYLTYSHLDAKKAVATPLTTSSVNLGASSSINTTRTNQVPFSKEQITSYYTLSKLVNDCGIPSPSMVTNLNAYNTVDGSNYYKTYSYATRADYDNTNDYTTTKDGNYSHLLSTKIINQNGTRLSESAFGNPYSKITNNQDKINDLYQIASLYVEGFTANTPQFKINSNNNCESSLNPEPNLAIDLNDTKTMNNETLYKVTVNINNTNVPIYVGLDGYIFVSSQNDFNKIFFPNKVK